jgi:hypothetical protein
MDCQWRGRGIATWLDRGEALAQAMGLARDTRFALKARRRQLTAKRLDAMIAFGRRGGDDG